MVLYTRHYGEQRNGTTEVLKRAADRSPLQGSAADIIKLAMIAVDKILPKDQAKMLLQVHDELVFEVEESIADKTCPKTD